MRNKPYSYGVAFSLEEWEVIKSALKFKYETAHRLGLATYSESEHELFKTINHKLKELRKGERYD